MMMERRMRGNSHVRCEAGEKSECYAQTLTYRYHTGLNLMRCDIKGDLPDIMSGT